jgi:hypothetical protein
MGGSTGEKPVEKTLFFAVVDFQPWYQSPLFFLFFNT